MPKALLASLFALGILAPVEPLEGQNGSKHSSIIRELGRKFSAAYVRGDAAAMAAIYTPDAVIFPERSEMIAGTEAILRYWTSQPGRRVTRHTITPTRIVVDGQHAYDYGTYVIAGEQNGKPWGPFAGKYVAVWRRDPGATWRMELDIWNSRANP
jgi:ketosteroid isomerase-like protein